MNDFSSAAMMRLIRLSLQRQGIAVPPANRADKAHVSLANKRVLLQQLWSNYGPAALAKVGEAVYDAPEEPTLIALSLAHDPPDLVERWQRLERFVHSRHRTCIEANHEGYMRLRHYSLEQAEPPTAAEDVLIFGLLIVLVERLGAEGLEARIVGERRWRRRKAAWREYPWPEEVSTWELRWTAARPAPGPASQQQSVDDWAASARRRMQRDPGFNWSVDALARSMGTSRRTLQRRFSQQRTSFSGLLAEARLSRAAQLLTSSDNMPAEIGYSCGFSDQAHFTRAFKRHTAFTPGNFRTQFAP